MNGFFNVGVGGLCFFCEYNIDVVIFQDMPLAAVHLICVKDKNQCTAVISLIIRKNIDQCISC